MLKGASLTFQNEKRIILKVSKKYREYTYKEYGSPFEHTQTYDTKWVEKHFELDNLEVNQRALKKAMGVK